MFLETDKAFRHAFSLKEGPPLDQICEAIRKPGASEVKKMSFAVATMPLLRVPRRPSIDILSPSPYWAHLAQYICYPLNATLQFLFWIALSRHQSLRSANRNNAFLAETP